MIPDSWGKSLLLLAASVSLGGCEALNAARIERLQNEAATMRSSGPPGEYRTLVRDALRRDLSRPDTFADGRISAPRPGGTNTVRTVNGVVMESSRRTVALGWVVCVRYRATSLLGLEGMRDSAVFINPQGEVSRVDLHRGQDSCATMPNKLMEPFSL